MAERAPQFDDIIARFRSTRALTESLCRPMKVEDQVVQAAPEASPPRWHLAHTSWFFEQFLLRDFEEDFRWHHPGYQRLFNSYYESVGEYFDKARRGTLSRPTVAEVLDYRAAVTERVCALARSLPDPRPDSQMTEIVELGTQHEQQHQELLLTDTLLNFWHNPLRPALLAGTPPPETATPFEWIDFPAGIVKTGHSGDDFAFDNERPSHRSFVESFAIASRPASNGQFLEFIEAGGYRRHELWLSQGWAELQRTGASAPLYWEKPADRWLEMSLFGMQPLDENAPLCHVSYFEADAFARWSGARLPSEAEWEHAARASLLRGIGRVWEWTRSAYAPYPGFQPLAGAFGEYNAKFMCNQQVLRGGSIVSPSGHLRLSYRNFFPPESRWQYSGVRLARDSA